MPLYEYSCTQCGVFDGIAPMAESSLPRRCPCGNMASKVIRTAPRVFGDLPGYESPIDGKWVEGKRARTEDLRKHGCRPYEDGEKEQMVVRQAANERKLDATVDAVVSQVASEIGMGAL